MEDAGRQTTRPISRHSSQGADKPEGRIPACWPQDTHASTNLHIGSASPQDAHRQEACPCVGKRGTQDAHGSINMQAQARRRYDKHASASTQTVQETCKLEAQARTRFDKHASASTHTVR